ncbi:MAG: translation initiation factor IF-2 [Patescibacteria group bacterium]
MNIIELARKLKITTNELHEKLPELGFDVGQKATKIDDILASRIVRAWYDFRDRERQKQEYEKLTKKDGDVTVKDKKVEIPGVLTVKDFAALLNLPVSIVITELMKSGVMASLNQRIDFDTAAVVASDLGFEATEINLEDKVEVDKAKRISDKLSLEKQENLEARPPIIVIMGHVDHGKTKLLDAIRKTNVVEGEAGGITQHIGAYQVEKRGRKLTFIDTPGHEAFTAMRSRGAKVADLAVLVVAATEGVKPQTVEALKIAKEADIPIIVALNKIDLPESNPDKVKQELAQYDLLAEEWGGKTIFVPISAKFNKNIDGLLDSIILLADMNADKIKANPKGEFVGTIIESHVDPGAGPVATILVKNGTLRVGDYMVMDNILYGKIKVLHDYLSKDIPKAEPSTPAEIMGLKIAPRVGDVLEVIDDPKKAEKAKVYRMQQEETFIKQTGQTDEEAAGGEPIVKLNIVIRTDVLGSQEAIIESLKKIENKFIKIDIIAKGLGSVSEGDVSSAEATGAIVFGFNVIPSSAANTLARDKQVEIKTYKIIYELIDEVKRRLKAMIKPEIVRRNIGKMKVLKIFKKATDHQVIGARVTSGKVEPGAKVAVLRADNFITSGKITELQIGKQIVRDAVQGQECGIKFVGQPIIEENDVLDVYMEDEVKLKIL